jgi:hypothetical protein
VKVRMGGSACGSLRAVGATVSGVLPVRPLSGPSPAGAPRVEGEQMSTEHDASGGVER